MLWLWKHYSRIKCSYAFFRELQLFSQFFPSSMLMRCPFIVCGTSAGPFPLSASHAIRGVIIQPCGCLHCCFCAMFAFWTRGGKALHSCHASGRNLNSSWKGIASVPCTWRMRMERRCIRTRWTFFTCRFLVADDGSSRPMSHVMLARWKGVSSVPCARWTPIACRSFGYRWWVFHPMSQVQLNLGVTKLKVRRFSLWPGFRCMQFSSKD